MWTLTLDKRRLTIKVWRLTLEPQRLFLEPWSLRAGANRLLANIGLFNAGMCPAHG
jgi:hypothetical protein